MDFIAIMWTAAQAVLYAAIAGIVIENVAIGIDFIYDTTFRFNLLPPFGKARKDIGTTPRSIKQNTITETATSTITETYPSMKTEFVTDTERLTETAWMTDTKKLTETQRITELHNVTSHLTKTLRVTNHFVDTKTVTVTGKALVPVNAPIASTFTSPELLLSWIFFVIAIFLILLALLRHLHHRFWTKTSEPKNTTTIEDFKSLDNTYPLLKTLHESDPRRLQPLRPLSDDEITKLSSNLVKLLYGNMSRPNPAEQRSDSVLHHFFTTILHTDYGLPLVRAEAEKRIMEIIRQYQPSRDLEGIITTSQEDLDLWNTDLKPTGPPLRLPPNTRWYGPTVQSSNRLREIKEDEQPPEQSPAMLERLGWNSKPEQELADEPAASLEESSDKDEVEKEQIFGGFRGFPASSLSSAAEDSSEHESDNVPPVASSPTAGKEVIGPLNLLQLTIPVAPVEVPVPIHTPKSPDVSQAEQRVDIVEIRSQPEGVEESHQAVEDFTETEEVQDRSDVSETADQLVESVHSEASPTPDEVVVPIVNKDTTEPPPELDAAHQEPSMQEVQPVEPLDLPPEHQVLSEMEVDEIGKIATILQPEIPVNDFNMPDVEPNHPDLRSIEQDLAYRDPDNVSGDSSLSTSSENSPMQSRGNSTGQNAMEDVERSLESSEDPDQGGVQELGERMQSLSLSQNSDPEPIADVKMPEVSQTSLESIDSFPQSGPPGELPRVSDSPPATSPYEPYQPYSSVLEQEQLQQEQLQQEIILSEDQIAALQAFLTNGEAQSTSQPASSDAEQQPLQSQQDSAPEYDPFAFLTASPEPSEPEAAPEEDVQDDESMKDFHAPSTDSGDGGSLQQTNLEENSGPESIRDMLDSSINELLDDFAPPESPPEDPDDNSPVFGSLPDLQESPSPEDTFALSPGVSPPPDFIAETENLIPAPLSSRSSSSELSDAPSHMSTPPSMKPRPLPLAPRERTADTEVDDMDDTSMSTSSIGPVQAEEDQDLATYAPGGQQFLDELRQITQTAIEDPHGAQAMAALQNLEDDDNDLMQTSSSSGDSDKSRELDPRGHAPDDPVLLDEIGRAARRASLAMETERAERAIAEAEARDKKEAGGGETTDKATDKMEVDEEPRRPKRQRDSDDDVDDTGADNDGSSSSAPHPPATGDEKEAEEAEAPKPQEDLPDYKSSSSSEAEGGEWTFGANGAPKRRNPNQ